MESDPNIGFTSHSQDHDQFSKFFYYIIFYLPLKIENNFSFGLGKSSRMLSCYHYLSELFGMEGFYSCK